VWEEDEFWIELSWRIDPDGALGIRKYFESPYRPGEKLRIEEFYRWIFERSVPGLPEAAQREASARSSTCASTARSWSRAGVRHPREAPLNEKEREGATGRLRRAPGHEERGAVGRGGRRPVVAAASHPLAQARILLADAEGLEVAEHAVPTYARSHVHWQEMDRSRGEMALLPTFGCRT
jgi:hypothetical protein